MEQKPRCRHCGDVIGTYEPMIVLVDGQPRRTAIAAGAHSLALDDRQCFHDACYLRPS